MIEPAPMKINVNVPMNSATARRNLSKDMIQQATIRVGRISRATPHTLRSHASEGHLFTQPDAVAVAYLPVLLQVLLLRHASRPPARARGGSSDHRWRRPPRDQGAARP